MYPISPEFIRQAEAYLGTDEAAALCAALEGQPGVSLRPNPRKPACLFPDISAEPVAWSASGRYLSLRPEFTLDPLFHAGCYYVQEAASMFVERAFAALPAPPARLLDLCAAPGGKSTLWRSLLPDEALLVANEPIRSRAEVLSENLQKWGHPGVVVTNAYPDELGGLRNFFDVVAADVPCSGEGMFRKDEEARREWSPENVAACADRQWQIISDIWPALRPGGHLIYSTCTFNPDEDERSVARICRELGAEPVPIDVEPSWGIVGDTTGSGLPVYHFFPHRARGEGFFLALLRKREEAVQPTPRTGRRRKNSVRLPKEALRLGQWLQTPDNFALWADAEGRVSAISRKWAEDAETLRASVRTLLCGIPLAEPKGPKYLPAHGLALSTARSEAAFPRAALSRTEALAYLRRETVTLGSDVPRGYVLVTYEGQALGFVNNLGSRANNLYPPCWRIRKQL